MVRSSLSLTDEYLLGLIDGEGCFSFHTTGTKIVYNKIVRLKVPVFALGMHERDIELVRAVRDHLGLKNRVYRHRPSLKDGYNRGWKANLFVRDFGSLKNTIVPFFYKRLRGYKAQQFHEWIMKIGSDERVYPKFKLIYSLYVSGYWDRNPYKPTLVCFSKQDQGKF